MSATRISRTSIAAGAVLAAGLAGASDANAQFWIGDRGLQQGHGLVAGGFEVHAGLGAEFGYDSNLVASSAAMGPVQALRLRITPSISIQTVRPEHEVANGSAAVMPVANFAANVAVSYHAFFPLGATTSALPQNTVGGTAGFRLELFPGRTFSFTLSDDVARVVQGGSQGSGTNLFVFNRIENSATATLAYQPSGGILNVQLGYTNHVSFIEDAGWRFLNVMSNSIALRMRWRFLPKTAVLFDAIFSPTIFLDPAAQANTSVGVFNSYPIAARFGLNGLLTDRVQLLAMVGYQGTYFGSGDNIDTVIGQAQISYLFDVFTAFRIGFIRDVQPSFLGNYYVRNKGYVEVNQSFGGVFYVNAQLGLGYLQYGYTSDPSGARLNVLSGSSVDPTTGRWSAVRLEALLFGEYRPANFLGINATLSASGNFADVMTSGIGGQQLSWFKFEAFIGVRLTY